MRCVLLLFALSLLPVSAPASAQAEFSTPGTADEVMRARDLPFQLRFDSDKWKLRPQRSGLALLARVVSLQGDVSGAFGYREVELTEAALRQREREELESAFATHEIAGFERRVVNGEDVLFMRAEATTEGGREVVVRSYLWQGPNGVADYGLVVNRELFERHRQDMMDLLNGFEVAGGSNQ